MEKGTIEDAFLDDTIVIAITAIVMTWRTPFWFRSAVESCLSNIFVRHSEAETEMQFSNQKPHWQQQSFKTFLTMNEGLFLENVFFFPP